MLGWVDGLSSLFATMPAKCQLFPQLPVQGHSHHATHSNLQLACIDSDDISQQVGSRPVLHMFCQL